MWHLGGCDNSNRKFPTRRRTVEHAPSVFCWEWILQADKYVPTCTDTPERASVLRRRFKFSSAFNCYDLPAPCMIALGNRTSRKSYFRIAYRNATRAANASQLLHRHMYPNRNCSKGLPPTIFEIYTFALKRLMSLKIASNSWSGSSEIHWKHIRFRITLYNDVYGKRT